MFFFIAKVKILIKSTYFFLSVYLVTYNTIMQMKVSFLIRASSSVSFMSPEVGWVIYVILIKNNGKIYRNE